MKWPAGSPEEQRFLALPMNVPDILFAYRPALLLRFTPIRYSEFGTVYLFQDRLPRKAEIAPYQCAFPAQDDAFLLQLREQLQGEFEQTLDEALRLMKAFGFEEFEYFLSTREDGLRGETDPIAEDAIRKALEKYRFARDIDAAARFCRSEIDINAATRSAANGSLNAGRSLPGGSSWKYRGAMVNITFR